MKRLLIDSTCVDVTDEDVISVLTAKISDNIPEACDAVVIGDLGHIIAKHVTWTADLPAVQPFYVVKCNDDPAVLSVLAQLGTGFVCYSKVEMQKILKLGVPATRILYGNPCRPSSQLQYAVQHGVEQLTFESETELRKISCKHRNAKLILRINPMIGDGVDELLFGCYLNDVSRLLWLARDLQSDVIGISMNLGDSCSNLSVLCDSVLMARAIFDLAGDIGFDFTLLDIGGDCFGKKSSEFCFEEFADVLRSSLDQCFSARTGVRVIVECGQFFVESAFCVAVDILEQRTESRDSADIAPDDAEAGNMNNLTSVYYVSDGVYGSFSRMLTDPVIAKPTLLNPSRYADEEWFVSSVRGPSCDSLDCLVADCMLPRLDAGDWLAFRDMGTYLFNSSSVDLGRAKNVEKIYIIQEGRWLQLCLAAETKSSVAIKHPAGKYEWGPTDYDRPDT